MVNCEEHFINPPCKYPAKYLVITGGIHYLVCGYHARGYLRKVLFRLVPVEEKHAAVR